MLFWRLVAVAVDCVERAPEGGQGFGGGGYDLVVAVGVGVFTEPRTPRFAVGFIGFFVDNEVGEGGGFIDAVEFAQAVHFRAGDLGDLRFVGVEPGHGFGYGAVPANFAEGGDYGLRAGKGGTASNVVFADSDGR